MQNDTVCINFEIGTKRYFLLFRQARRVYATGVKAMVSLRVAGGRGELTGRGHEGDSWGAGYVSMVLMVIILYLPGKKCT